MSYIGFKPVQGNAVVDEFISTGGSTYTLSSEPSGINSIEIVVGGLTQTSSAYSVSGTTLTIAGVPSGTKIIARQHGEKLLLPTIPADNTITLNHLNTTGTPSSALALKGDFSWGTAGGPSLGSGDECIRTNSNQVNQNVTIPSGTNAASIGPITIGSSYAITISSGATYTVI